MTCVQFGVAKKSSRVRTLRRARRRLKIGCEDTSAATRCSRGAQCGSLHRILCESVAGTMSQAEATDPDPLAVQDCFPVQESNCTSSGSKLILQL